MELTGFFGFFFFRGEPVEESANGRRGVGVKVDVGGTKQFLPLPDDTAPYQAVVRALRPLVLQGLALRGLEFDSF